LSTKFSVPTNLGGPGIGTNPEELLLSAAYGCYLITLAILLTNRKIPFTRIELESEGFVINDKGLQYDRIEHRPTIYVDQPVDEEYIVALAKHAEHACMVSSALRGNVVVNVEPRVLVQATQ
jgi:peroxiredoxin-like protein